MLIIPPEGGTEVYNKNSVFGKILLSKDEVEVVRLELGPRSSLPVHTTPVDVFFYVIQGKGEIEVGAERKVVSAGMLIDSPKGISHGLHNPGEEVFRVLVVKTPKP